MDDHITLFKFLGPKNSEENSRTLCIELILLIVWGVFVTFVCVLTCYHLRRNHLRHSTRADEENNGNILPLPNLELQEIERPNGAIPDRREFPVMFH